jgi:hypothetical protein
MRYTLSAGATAAVLPLIQKINIGPTNALAAGLSWIGFALMLVTLKRGQSWREKVDDTEKTRKEQKTDVLEKIEQEQERHNDSRDAEERAATAARLVEESRRTSMTLHEHHER